MLWSDHSHPTAIGTAVLPSDVYKLKRSSSKRPNGEHLSPRNAQRIGVMDLQVNKQTNKTDIGIRSCQAETHLETFKCRPENAKTKRPNWNMESKKTSRQTRGVKPRSSTRHKLHQRGWFLHHHHHHHQGPNPKQLHTERSMNFLTLLRFPIWTNHLNQKL